MNRFQLMSGSKVPGFHFKCVQTTNLTDLNALWHVFSMQAAGRFPVYLVIFLYVEYCQRQRGLNL